MRDEAAKQKAEDSSNITPANSVSSNPLNNFQAHYFLFAFFLITVLLGLVLWPFWQLLIMAFLLAGIFRPAYSYLLKAVPPWFSSLLTCALIVLIVFIPLMFCIGALSSEALNVYQLGKDSNVLLKVQHLLQNNTLAMEAQEVLARYNINFNPTDLTGMIAGMARTLGLFIYNQASTWAGNIMSFALQFCILILVTFFLFMELDRLIYFLKKLSPLPDKQTDLLMDKFMEISGAILVGNGISGVFQGVLGGILFVFLGIKSPVLWGAIMAILAFLPIFGIGLVLIPTALILAFNSHIGQGLITISFYVVLSFSVEYLIKPKLVGDHVQMHTLLVFLTIIGGMSVFGILGIIYGPLIVTAFLTLSEIYLRNYTSNNNKI